MEEIELVSFVVHIMFPQMEEPQLLRFVVTVLVFVAGFRSGGVIVVGKEGFGELDECEKVVIMCRGMQPPKAVKVPVVSFEMDDSNRPVSSSGK